MNEADPEARLADVYVARIPREGEGVPGCRPGSDRHGCFLRNRVEWVGEHPGPRHRQVTWHFRAPDAESVRIALRSAGIPFDDVWVDAAPR